MNPGLNETTSIGRVGAYRPRADHANSIQLTTCVARETDFEAIHRGGIIHLGGPWLPLEYQRMHLGSSWTGRGYRYSWGDDGFDLYLKSTLPGALFVTHRETLSFRFAMDNGVPKGTAIETGETFLAAWSQFHTGRVLLLDNWGIPTLIVSSIPVVSQKWTSHDCLDLTFAAPQARVLFVPLLRREDAPQNAQEAAVWIQLAEHPPLSANEEFSIEGAGVIIRQTFSGLDGETPVLSPLPPASHFSPLETRPTARTLVHGFFGPYQVVEGNSHETRIPLDWTRVRMEPRKTVQDVDLNSIPHELAYAGDVTWEPGTALDQLLSLRIWAPLAAICPPRLWENLRPQLTPPTADKLRESLTIIREPVSGRSWSKEAKLFEVAGDICYDSDWYNGFELSGIWRATQCADEEIAAKAKVLAANAVKERELLANYFTIFHDWELGAAWSSPRGQGWNCDCSHNGLEGILAESHLRRSEGNAAGADFLLYLAAKTASTLMAAEHMIDYQVDIGYVRNGSPCNFVVEPDGSADPTEWLHGTPGGEPTFGMDGIFSGQGASAQCARSKNPYILAPHFPEFNALQKRYGFHERYQLVIEDWAARFQKRYEDWIVFYCGVNPELDLSAMHSQEARVQASVMYHLAPEVCFRLWTLGQPSEEIEKLFRTPLNLAEQLLCRADVQLVTVS